MAAVGAELHVLLGGERMGTLVRDARDQLDFSYSDAWLAKDSPVPLSLSMPVLPTPYRGRPLENWLWGLLPDNEQTLQGWAQEFKVSPRNVFALLGHLGEDVAGAVQFVRPERVDQVTGGGKVKWLTPAELGERLVELNRDPALARHADDAGRFSLAGAQSKTALLFQKDRWGVPSGRTPTNRIIKLTQSRYPGLIENEHFCLSLAGALGLTAARTSVMVREGVTAIVVERYDRVEVKGALVRIHQEDMCQALGIHPTGRYQNEGGPGVVDIFEILQGSSESLADREAFLRAQVFNFLVGGTDAHAKNFGVLLGEEGAVRLAPLYDIASMLPYADFRKMKLAMRIGTTYGFEETLPRHWDALGQKVRIGLRATDVLEEYAQALPEASHAVAAQCREQGIIHPVIVQLVDGIASMCQRTLAQLEHFHRLSAPNIS